MPKRPRRHKTQTAIMLAMMAVLSACGGGSSTPSTPIVAPPPPSSPPPPSPPPSDFNTTEFRRNYGLAQINAIPAYEAGATGNGVIVGVVDTGIDIDHPELIGRIHSASTNTFNPALGINDADGHGTLVAGVIAGNRNSLGAHGVAFQSQILAIRAEDPATCDDEELGCQLNDRDIAEGIDVARQNGARIINLSLGGDGVGFSVLSAVSRATEAGIIIVISAGNADDETTQAEQDNPTRFAQLGLTEFANGRVIIAGATDENELLASFSHRAGVARDIYVVAPGVRIFAPINGGGNALASGTSFAAPHVAGAFALLIDLFPNLLADELISLLLTTTRDLGASGTDAIYGRGLIDIGAAIAPQGVESVSVTGVNGVTVVPLPGSGAQTPGALGDALTAIPELRRTVFLDSYERGYLTDLTSRLFPLSNTPNLLGRLDNDTRLIGGGARIGDAEVYLSAVKRFESQRHIRETIGGAFEDVPPPQAPRFAFSSNFNGYEIRIAHGYSLAEQFGAAQHRFLSRDAFITPHLNSAGDQQSLVLTRNMAGGHLSFGAAYAENSLYAPALFGPEDVKDITAQSFAARYENSGFAIEIGAKRENNQVLGGVSEGALRLGEGALTSFVSFNGERDIGRGLTFAAQASVGITHIQRAEASIFTDTSALTTTAFSAGLFKDGVFNEGDWLGFSLSQPLRVESGAARLSIPTGVAYTPGETTVLFDDVIANLSPSGRELDIEMAYRWSLSKSMHLEANVMRQFDAGHVKGRGATAALLRLSRRF